VSKQEKRQPSKGPLSDELTRTREFEGAAPGVRAVTRGEPANQPLETPEPVTINVAKNRGPKQNEARRAAIPALSSPHRERSFVADSKAQHRGVIIRGGRQSNSKPWQQQRRGPHRQRELPARRRVAAWPRGPTGGNQRPQGRGLAAARVKERSCSREDDNIFLVEHTKTCLASP